MRIEDLLIPLEEAVGANRLYHWTGFNGINGILYSNEMVAQKSQFSDMAGVSFSRIPHATGISDVTNSVVVVDRNKLSYNYKLIPRYGDMQKAADFAKKSGGEYDPIEPRKETEELVPSNIKPISRYLTHVCMPSFLIGKMAFEYVNRAIYRTNEKPFPLHLDNEFFRTMNRLVNQYPHVGLYIFESGESSNPTWVMKLDSDSVYPATLSPEQWKQLLEKYWEPGSETKEYISYIMEFLDWFSEHPEYLAPESA
jgi:hypothetical protein